MLPPEKVGPVSGQRDGGPGLGRAAEGRTRAGGAILVTGLRHLARGRDPPVAAWEGRLRAGSAGYCHVVPRRLLGSSWVEGPVRIEHLHRPSEGLRGGPESGHAVHAAGGGAGSSPMHGH